MSSRGSIHDQVAHEVALWLRWLPRWHPESHRGRSRLCRRCFGSPVLAAVGIDSDVPHGVQHAFSMRMKGIVDAAVDDYTEHNLPNLYREIQQSEARKARRSYRPTEGLDPEHVGLELDPEPIPGQPFLFTLGGLEQAESEAVAEPPPEPFSEAQKQALRAELVLADEYASQIGRELCAALLEHRLAVRDAVQRIIEPQVAELMADLERELDAPDWLGGR